MAAFLRATFLGHQGWIVESAGSAIAIDPVVCEGFGHSPGTDFIVYPPRKVELARLPAVNAILLSHEHLDHFHLPSLNAFSREAKVFFGPLMPRCVENAIQRLGFTTCRVDAPGEIIIGNLIVDVFPAGRTTVTWERSVTSFSIRSSQSIDASIFIAVDAIISEEYIERIADGRVKTPTLMVVSNNSQIVPRGGFGAQSNLLPIDVDRRNGITGLQVLSDILVGYLADLPEIRNIAICGNGFVNNIKPYGPFEFSDNKTLANLANSLSLREQVFGPFPGETLTVHSDGSVEQGHCDYILLEHERMAHLLERREAFLKASGEEPSAPLWIEGQASEREMVETVDAFLQTCVPALLVSPTGQAMLEQHSYLDGPTSSFRAVFRFLTGNRTIHLVFDASSGRFENVQMSAHDAMYRIPFGIEFYLSDFYAVLRGKIQIWDLIGSNVRSWFMGSKYANLTSFLFTVLGEQARQDLASMVYNSAIERMTA